MASLLEKLALAAARRRSLLKVLGPLLPETGELEVQPGLKVSLYLKDFTGPSFYLNYGGPQAFFHYEEAEKAEILRYMPVDGVFLDIGANIGLFSLFIACRLREARVFAFEPHPTLSACLRRTCERSGIRNLRCEAGALGASEGRFQLHLHSRNSGGHSLLPSQIGDQERGSSVEVHVEALDAFVAREKLSRLDVIKIDVQGAEWDVFAGGAGSIERFKPVIIAELENDALAEPMGTVRSVLERFESLGYRFRAIGETSEMTLAQASASAAERLQKGEVQANYVLALKAT
jgi:FkbM family methyltransferase